MTLLQEIYTWIKKNLVKRERWRGREAEERKKPEMRGRGRERDGGGDEKTWMKKTSEVHYVMIKT